MIAEIIGPAGAGKSTLSKLLNERSPQIKAGISIWGQSHLRLAGSMLISIPTLTRASFKFLGFEECKHIVRIEAFHRYLDGTYDGSPATFYLDEGIVFAISSMRFERRKYSRALEQWEKRTIRRSVRLLDRIVWLDAHDDVLIERIRGRRKEHRIKGCSNSEISGFLTRYRQAYEFVVGRLKEHRNIDVLRFDTSSAGSIPEIAERLSSTSSILR